VCEREREYGGESVFSDDETKVLSFQGVCVCVREREYVCECVCACVCVCV